MPVFGRRAPVDDYQFPSSLRQHFAFQHPELPADALPVIEAGGRQWFRLRTRHRRARLTMPSVIVADFVGEAALHDREHADAEPVAVADRARLGETFRLARQDEKGDALPVLFRVDRELDISGGWNYLADCGGRGVCYELKDTICLQHLKGPGKRIGGGGTRNRPGDGYAESSGGGIGGDGCGGGCGGGN
jgi:hypothetical protein